MTVCASIFSPACPRWLIGGITGLGGHQGGGGDQEEGHPVGTGRVGYEGEAAITWSVAMFCPLLRSHTLAVSSRPPVASCLPSGLKATL